MIQPGTKLAHYEIVGALGKGGMGEVWRARDTTLGREVAIKTLPDEFAEDADRLARFEREAKLLASLNHPNIAAIYGLEEHEGSRFLVLELLEGDTLGDRIRRGPIPIEESLKLALQIADALKAAHESGVIHRDLKPDNVKVSDEGTVKVLDFGLAKTVAADHDSVNASNSPTLSMAATRAGIILGTAAYMSPEQAKGRAADRRADIWAFGCVLYEMLSGRQSFGKSDITESLAAAISLEPDWSLLPPNLHPRLDETIRRCLNKKLSTRYQDIGDVRNDIELALGDSEGTLVRSPSSDDRPRPLAKIFVGTMGLAMAFVLGAWVLSSGELPEARKVVRFPYDLPADHVFIARGRNVVAVAPDGTYFVYNTTQGLVRRPLADLEPRLLLQTTGFFTSPFISPDSQWIGFFSDGELQKVALSGGARQAIGPASNPFGVTWNADDRIFFAQQDGIWQVSANGGEPDLVIETRDGELLDGPQLIKDDWLLFTAASALSVDWDTADIVAESMSTGDRIRIWTGSDAKYVPSGHLVYALNDDLYAIPMDLDTLEVRGSAERVAEGVARALATASANYGISDDGSLIYVASDGASGASSFVWVNVDGDLEPITTLPERVYASPRLSPDETRLLVEIEGDIWVFEIATARGTAVTTHGRARGYAFWNSLGTQVAYTAAATTSDEVWIQPLDGGPARQVTEFGEGTAHIDSWSQSANLLAVHHHRASSDSTDIYVVDLDQESATPELILGETYDESEAQFSPDARFLAYVSRRTGQNQVYVRPFPGPGREEPVSVDGGVEPIWARNGDLFYRDPNNGAMMRAHVETDPVLRVDDPELLFQNNYRGFQGASPRALFDVTGDGQRFLMQRATSVDDESVGQPRIIVVENFFNELLERVPVD